MAEAKIAGCTTTTTIKTQFSHCCASKHLQPLLPFHANPLPPHERTPPLNEIFGMGPPPPPAAKVNWRMPLYWHQLLTQPHPKGDERVPEKVKILKIFMCHSKT